MTRKKTSAGSAGDWCAVCWHCITWSQEDSRWLHVSSDDWSEDSCSCASRLTACSPKGAKPQGPLPQRKRACGPAVPAPVSAAAEIRIVPGISLAAMCRQLRVYTGGYAGKTEHQEEQE
jgi:hypothetical protein